MTPRADGWTRIRHPIAGGATWPPLPIAWRSTDMADDGKIPALTIVRIGPDGHDGALLASAVRGNDPSAGAASDHRWCRRVCRGARPGGDRSWRMMFWRRVERRVRALVCRARSGRRGEPALAVRHRRVRVAAEWQAGTAEAVNRLRGRRLWPLYSILSEVGPICIHTKKWQST